MPVPLVSETFSQLALELAVQDVFELTLIVWFAADMPGFQVLGDTVRFVPCWVTLIVSVSVSVDTVIVPDLSAADVFALVVLIVRTALPLALPGETDSQSAALLFTLAVQDLLEVTFIVVDVIIGVGFHVVLATINIGIGAACWVTVIVLVSVPDFIVIVPLLGDVKVFSLALIVSEPFPFPLPGVTESQLAALLLTVAAHGTSEVMSTFTDAPGDTGFHVVVDTKKTAAPAACCVTSTVIRSDPALTVIVPSLCESEVFSLAVIVNVPSSVPLEGETDSQLEAMRFTLADHDRLDVTAIVLVAASDERFQFVDDSTSVGA